MNPALPFKLRSDLIITTAATADRSADTYMIKHPGSGEIFELGKEEFFLARCLDGYVGLADVVQRFGLEFGLSISEEYLQQFIQQIGDFGLLEPLSSPVDSSLIDTSLTAPSLIDTEIDSLAPETDSSITSEASRANSLSNGTARLMTDGQRDAHKSYSSLAPAAVALRENESTYRQNSQSARSSDVAANAFSDSVSQDNLRIETTARRDRWRWFNPMPLLRVVNALFSPLRPFMRIIVWLMIPAVAVGGTIFFKNQALLWQDIERLKSPGSYAGSLLFNLVTVNLISRLAIGAACAHYGGDVKEFGLRLKFGLIPRFYIDASSASRFDRRAKLWTYGTALLLRITLFLVGIFAWILFRGSSTQLTVNAISMAQAGFIGFIIVSAPVRASFGYRWFTTLLHLPTNLLQRAFAVFGATLRGRDLPSTLSRKSRLALWIYALLLIICWSLIALKLTMSIASGLNSTFPDIFGRATPFLLIAGVAYLFSRWFWSAKLKGMVQSGSEKSDRNRELDYPWNTRSSSQRSWLSSSWLKRSRWLLAAMLLTAVLLRPYPYRPGGAVQLIPPQQQQIQVPVAGQIAAVYVDGANGQWLKKGEIVASMAAVDLQNDVATLEEQIIEQQADIRKEQSALSKVKAGPRPEAVDVAQRQVAIAQGEVQEAQKQLEAAAASQAIAQQQIETAQVQIPYRVAQVERFQRLYEEGVYSAQGVEEAQAQVDVTQAEITEAQQAYSYAIKQTETARQALVTKQRELERAQAELTLVQSEALPEDVEAATQEVNAAQAQLRALQQNLSHTQAQLQSASLVMPIDGYIVTPYLKQQVGSYLEPGATFATVQADQIAIAELQLPEYDSGELTRGSTATVKLLAFPNAPMSGEILAIEPTTSEELYGRILTILIRLDNSDQHLKAGMTGYAKIEAGEKPLYVLLTRPIVRFVQIELWSWLP